MTGQIELTDIKLNYVSIAEARKMTGLRLILGAYPIPGPWREACKALFHVKVARDREVHAAVLARQDEAHQPGVGEDLELAARGLGVEDAAVDETRPLAVHLRGVRRDLLGGDLSDELQRGLDELHRFLEAPGRELVGIGKILLKGGQDGRPGRRLDASAQIGGAQIEIRHATQIVGIDAPGRWES